MSQILEEFIHSNILIDNIIVKSWIYYKDNSICKLEYHNNTFNDIKNNKIFETERYYNITHEFTESIQSIDDWLDNNKCYFIDANDNYKKSIITIEWIKTHLGNYTKITPYKCIWYIHNVMTLTVHLYKNEIVLNYKNNNTILNDKKLTSFIEKNKNTILYAQNKIKQQSIQKIQTTQQHNLNINNITNINLNNSATIATVKTKPVNFYIKRSLKERYEIQACKPLPVTYPWDQY